MYPTFLDIKSWVSTSYEEPKAWSRKRAKSASVGFAAPSAMLLLMETTARLN